jgi:hypothetical protein
MAQRRRGPRPGPAMEPDSGSVAVTVSRLASRALAVAGLAGGVWLLTSFAAHAAMASGPSTVGGAPDADTGSVQTAAAPVRADLLDQPLAVLGLVTRPASRLLADVLAPTDTLVGIGTTNAPVTNPAPSGAGPMAGDLRPVAARQAAPRESLRRSVAARTGAGLRAGSADLVRTVRGLFAPLGLADLAGPPLDLLRPMIGIADSVLLPVTDLRHPFGDRPQTMLAPSSDGRSALARPPAPLGMRSTAGAAGHPAGAIRHRTAAGQTAGVPAGSAGVVPADGLAQVYRSGAPAVPAPSSPAPMPAYPGSGSTGASTTASGSHPVGGAIATAPVPVASGQVDSHRRAGAADVAVRRLIAEIPTFSPD